MTSPSTFARLARWCFAHRFPTLLVWVAILVGVTLIAGAVGKEEASDFRLPGTESQQVLDQLERSFPQASGDSDQLVFALRGDAETSTFAREGGERARAQSALADVAKAPGVAAVSSPFASNARERGGRVSEDGRTALAEVTYDGTVDDATVADLERVEELAFEARSERLQVEHGGPGAQTIRFSEGGSEQLIGILAAAIVLLFTFGSVVAAGLPIVVALFALGTTLGGITLISRVADTPDFATQLAELIGLGVGIDYALLLLTRYRAEVRDGRPRAEAAEVAMDTAGRTVLFAAITVVIALLGLLLLGLSFLHGVALGAALAVLLMMSATLTLLPALLAIVGDKIDRLRLPLPGRRKREERVAREGEGAAWRRLAAFVARRPWPIAIASVAVLLALAAPALGLRLGSSDAGVDPPSTTTRKAYDLNAAAFGVGVNGTFLVTVEGGRQAAQEVARGIEREDGVSVVAPPQASPDGRLSTIALVPEGGPQDEATTELLERLRAEVAPSLERETGAQVAIGGLTATYDDFATAIAEKLPLFVGVVVLLSALLLLVVFRSIAIPIKAAAMNLLTIAASLGLVTAIFQGGFLAGPLGIETGPIEPFLPVLMFAIVFGLSMDYEVFLMARMHEEWKRTGDAREAVSEGLARTGRVVTAAAAIMVVVFAAFALGDDRVIKLFGIGLASAVLIDAFLIRCLLVPAIMEILGRRAWWLPARLERALPELAIERG